MASAWSWSTTLCLGHSGQHRSVPIRVQSDRPQQDLPSLVNRAAFVLCFVPCGNSQQIAEIVAKTLSATSQSRIQVNTDDTEVIVDASHAFVVETHSWGRVEILHETTETGLYHLHLSPHEQIPRHIHKHLAEVEMIISQDIWCQEGPMKPNDIVAWPRLAPHSYHNKSPDKVLSILCVNQPRFDHVDEIVVDGSIANSSTLQEARREICHDPWSNMLERGAEFRFQGAFSGQDVTYFVRNEIRQDADAALIAILDGSKIVICQHHKRGWELPGGKRDPGETIEETARREALEETGIILAPNLISLGYFIGTGNGPKHVKQVFMATIQEQSSEWNKDEILQVGRADPMDFARRSGSDSDVSFLCRDSVVPIIASLLQFRIP